MEKIEIHSTSRHHAVSSDIIVREGDRTRLVFRPEIVDNPSNPAACVKGTFLYMRKGRADQWEDSETKPLSSFKKGDQYQIEIHSGELLSLLLRGLAALYRLHWADGVPQGRVELVKIEQDMAKLIQLSEPELNGFLATNRGNAIKTLSWVLRWLANRPPTEDNSATGDAELPELNALVGLANLRAVLKTWSDNSENPSEEFWQGVLAKHSFVLSQLFAYPVVVINQKAYVGGKRIDNRHGNLADFLCRVPTTGAAVLVEIKTPKTSLLGPKYRQVFPPSRELGGAISQVLEYRESLMREVHTPQQGQGTEISSGEPRCLVIAGCCARDLTDDVQKRSFERFRERLGGVTVVSFDEVFDRIGNLVKLFEAEI